MLKKSLCLLLAVAMLFSFTACKSKNNDTSSDVSDITVSNESVESDTTEETTSVEDKTESETTSEKNESVSSKDKNTSSKDKTSSKNSSSSKKQNSSSKKETSSKQQTSTESVTSLSSVPKSLQGTTITVYSWNAAKDVPGATTVISKFQKETKIKVKWNVGTYANYKSEIAAMVAARNAPDVIRLRGVEPGILSLMDPINVTGYEFKDKEWDSFVSETYTVKGKVYAVNRANTLLKQPLTMFYNRELITKYDLQDPYAVWKQNKSNWNWETFLNICNEYKKAAGADSKPWMLNSFKDYAMTMGADLVKRQGDTFVSNMSDKNLLLGFQKVAELRANGIAHFGWDMNGFNNGQYLFFGPAIISARRTHFDLTDLKNKGSLGMVPYPSVSGQTQYYQNIFEIEAYGVPKGATNAAAVPYFLNYYLDGDKYDSSTFFNDKRILDVYNYCTTQTTLVAEYDRWIVDMDFSGNESYHEFNSKLETASPDQIPNLINTYAPIVEKAAKDATTMIAEDVG